MGTSAPGISPSSPPLSSSPPRPNPRKRRCGLLISYKKRKVLGLGQLGGHDELDRQGVVLAAKTCFSQSPGSPRSRSWLIWFLARLGLAKLWSPFFPETGFCCVAQVDFRVSNLLPQLPCAGITGLSGYTPFFLFL